MIDEIKAGTADGKKVAVVGAGPAGIASAYFLARAGASVTVFEKEEKVGGVIRYVIPGFRISDDAIDKRCFLHPEDGCGDQNRYRSEIRTGIKSTGL